MSTPTTLPSWLNDPRTFDVRALPRGAAPSYAAPAQPAAALPEALGGAQDDEMAQRMAAIQQGLGNVRKRIEALTMPGVPTFRPTWKQALLSGLAGGMAGATEGGNAGIKTGMSFEELPYEMAKEKYGMQLQNLEQQRENYKQAAAELAQQGQLAEAQPTAERTRELAGEEALRLREMGKVLGGTNTPNAATNVFAPFGKMTPSEQGIENAANLGFGLTLNPASLESGTDRIAMLRKMSGQGTPLYGANGEMIGLMPTDAQGRAIPGAAPRLLPGYAIPKATSTMEPTLKQNQNGEWQIIMEPRHAMVTPFVPNPNGTPAQPGAAPRAAGAAAPRTRGGAAVSPGGTGVFNEPQAFKTQKQAILQAGTIASNLQGILTQLQANAQRHGQMYDKIKNWTLNKLYNMGISPIGGTGMQQMIQNSGLLRIIGASAFPTRSRAYQYTQQMMAHLSNPAGTTVFNLEQVSSLLNKIYPDLLASAYVSQFGPNAAQVAKADGLTLPFADVMPTVTRSGAAQRGAGSQKSNDPLGIL